MHLYDLKEHVCLVKLPLFRRDDSRGGEGGLFQDDKLTGFSTTKASERLGPI